VNIHASKTQETERRKTVNKAFGKLATAAMLVAALLLLAASLLTQRVGAVDIAKKDSRRAFYLTPLDAYDGSQALNACAAGFHMASLWEIHDPSNLRYDTTRGFATADSGSGPPSGWGGWIRTGNDALGESNVVGAINCNAWTSNSVNHFGSGVLLQLQWGSLAESLISPWRAGGAACNIQIKVWCVED
jgi:hypothetical protein